MHQRIQFFLTCARQGVFRLFVQATNLKWFDLVLKHITGDKNLLGILHGHPSPFPPLLLLWYDGRLPIHQCPTEKGHCKWPMTRISSESARPSMTRTINSPRSVFPYLPFHIRMFWGPSTALEGLEVDMSSWRSWCSYFWNVWFGSFDYIMFVSVCISQQTSNVPFSSTTSDHHLPSSRCPPLPSGR